MNIAHVRKLPDGSWDVPHSLDEHLEQTAKLAEQFADAFNSGKWGKTAGLAHDIGKGCQKWQEYLCNKSGYSDEDAHLEGNVGKIEHSIAGAKFVTNEYEKSIGRILAYCISGHHAGLPDWYAGDASSAGALSVRLSKADLPEVTSEFRKKLDCSKPDNVPWKFSREDLDISMWIRMLFSCLVDADFLDTERYMNPQKADSRGNYLNMQELLCKYNLFMEKKHEKAERTVVNEIRKSILDDCRNAAPSKPGIFSLNVPTGGGKTLSSLAFALGHAVKNNLNRIIYVIPYTSIIEQNADVFREALGDDQVIEHHSNLDEIDSNGKSRLAAENWDAPLIVTTSVQFFESLFACRTSKCRKLHSIVNSVVILDEAQLVPVDFLSPIIQTIEILNKRYNVSFVISTATQPAFESHKDFKGLPVGSVKEIITDVSGLFKKLKRVKIEKPIDWKTPVSFEELSQELIKEDKVLCVVSDRKSCRELHRLMPPDTFHLSALMCGQHRSDIISQIKQKLVTDKQVRVISTQ